MMMMMMITRNGPMMGHLNSFSASGGGNLNKNFAKNTNARGLPGGGMLKLRFDWYIMACSHGSGRPRRGQVPLLPVVKKYFSSQPTPGSGVRFRMQSLGH